MYRYFRIGGGEIEKEVVPKILLRLDEQQKLRKLFNIPIDSTVLLSVGEVNKNKNHRIAIDALKLMKDEGKLPDTWYRIYLIDYFERI